MRPLLEFILQLQLFEQVKSIPGLKIIISLHIHSYVVVGRIYRHYYFGKPTCSKKLEDCIFYSVVEYIIKQLFEQTRPTRIQGQAPFAMSLHTT